MKLTRIILALTIFVMLFQSGVIVYLVSKLRQSQHSRVFVCFDDCQELPPEQARELLKDHKIHADWWKP